MHGHSCLRFETSSDLVAMTTTTNDVAGSAAGLDESLLDLVEEVVRADSKAEQREPKDHVTVERHTVLTESIPDDLLGPRVVDAVDLDHDCPSVPTSPRVRPNE